MKTDNFEKHTSKNPLKKIFIGNFFKTVLNQLKNLNLENILDVGCGEGFTLNKLKENNVGKKYLGIDYSKTAIEIGKKLYSDLDLKTGNIYKLGFKDNSFDLVICSEVLEHLENPKKGLKELIRVSKKYILLSVPNEPFFEIFNFTQWGKDIGHINHWTSFGFRKFVESEKVKIIYFKTPFPWAVVLLEKCI